MSVVLIILDYTKQNCRNKMMITPEAWNFVKLYTEKMLSLLRDVSRGIVITN